MLLFKYLLASLALPSPSAHAEFFDKTVNANDVELRYTASGGHYSFDPESHVSKLSVRVKNPTGTYTKKDYIASCFPFEYENLQRTLEASRRAHGRVKLNFSFENYLGCDLRITNPDAKVGSEKPIGFESVVSPDKVELAFDPTAGHYDFDANSHLTKLDIDVEKNHKSIAGSCYEYEYNYLQKTLDKASEAGHKVKVSFSFSADMGCDVKIEDAGSGANSIPPYEEAPVAPAVPEANKEIVPAQ